MAFAAERFFPAGVTGPRERAPLARLAAIRRREDIGFPVAMLERERGAADAGGCKWFETGGKNPKKNSTKILWATDGHG
jgi:hypothetical protein